MAGSQIVNTATVRRALACAVVVCSLTGCASTSSQLRTLIREDHAYQAVIEQGDEWLNENRLVDDVHEWTEVYDLTMEARLSLIEETANNDAHAYEVFRSVACSERERRAQLSETDCRAILGWLLVEAGQRQAIVTFENASSHPMTVEAHQRFRQQFAEFTVDRAQPGSSPAFDEVMSRSRWEEAELAFANLDGTEEGYRAYRAAYGDMPEAAARNDEAYDVLAQMGLDRAEVEAVASHSVGPYDTFAGLYTERGWTERSAEAMVAFTVGP